MLRWLCALVAGVVVSGFALLLVTGQYRKEGPVLIAVTTNHGLHAGDVFVIAGWAVAMLALFLLAALPGRWSTASLTRSRRAPDAVGAGAGSAGRLAED